MERKCSTCKFSFLNNEDKGPYYSCFECVGYCQPPHSKWQPVVPIVKNKCNTCCHQHICSKDTKERKQGNYCENYWHYKPFELTEAAAHIKIHQEKLKMKRVVLEMPNTNPEITYKWLEQEGACKNGKIWFVETFGNKTDWKTFEKYFEEKIKKNHCKIFKDGEEIFSVDWLYWVEGKLKFDYENIEYVSISNISTDKFYFFYSKSNNHIHQLFEINGQYFWVSISRTLRTPIIPYKSYVSFRDAIIPMLKDNNVVYEFNIWKDALVWINEVLKGIE